MPSRGTPACTCVRPSTPSCNFSMISEGAAYRDEILGSDPDLQRSVDWNLEETPWQGQGISEGCDHESHVSRTSNHLLQGRKIPCSRYSATCLDLQKTALPALSLVESCLLPLARRRREERRGKGQRATEGWEFTGKGGCRTEWRGGRGGGLALGTLPCRANSYGGSGAATAADCHPGWG